MHNTINTATGNISGNIQHYATALGDQIAKLEEEDRRTAFQALHGILAEVERVEGLELLPILGEEPATA